MNFSDNPPLASPALDRIDPGVLRACLLFCGIVALCSVLAATLLPKSYALAAVGDCTQTGLVATASVLAFQNAARSRSHVRGFWTLIFLGTAVWVVSLVFWSVYELWFRREVPDIPIADILLFVKLVPLTAAIALEPQKTSESRFRAFGLLDVCILTLFSLYLFAFCVSAYRLVPGATNTYNFHFNLADAIGNQIFALVAGIAVLRTTGAWRTLYRVYFFTAAAYCLASDMGNAAIDAGRYYTGSLFDVPLNISLSALVAFVWIGRSLLNRPACPVDLREEGPRPVSRFRFVSSHLAMVVTLCTPAIGIWLMTRAATAPLLFPFRLTLTLVTIFLLTLLLALKQHLLTQSLVHSLRDLSETYASIDRFKDQLTQNEKLAALGASVAQVANQIRKAMAIIRERSRLITVLPVAESRIQTMAAKIGQYAQRTDALVEGMLRFAQETPLQLASLEIKPLLESTLQLSRSSKLSNVHVTLLEAGHVPAVLGDSSQLMHVFLQIISNAVDSLQEVGGGTLEIRMMRADAFVRIEFHDSGAGIREPEHVFEPFYTTKPIGQGTGLGLSTCYGIIQKHGGEIDCRNRPEGGALFTLLIPIDPQFLKTPSAILSGVLEGAR